MDIILRFWMVDTDTVSTRYYTSRFLGHATAVRLREEFSNAISKICAARVIQVSLDGPNVNLKFLREYQEARVEEGLSKVLDIGSCQLHVIHGAFQAGFKECKWDLHKVLKATHILFIDSPARREDYITQAKSTDFPSSFCATRWVEYKSVADKLIGVWENIKVLQKWWVKEKKEPKTKSYDTIKSAKANVFTIAKLQYFSYIAELIQPYLKTYQTSWPMVPFWKEDLSDLLSNLLKIFVKPASVSRCLDSMENI